MSENPGKIVPLEIRTVEVTEDLIAEMSKEDIDDVVSRLGNALRKAENVSYYVLGGLLSAVYRQQLYLELGFEKFEEYCRGRLGFSLRKALYLIAIWEKFEIELRVPPSDYEDIEWSKLKELLPVVNADNVHGWLDIARSNTAEEIRYQVRRELAGDEEEVEKTSPFAVYLFPGEMETVSRAFDAAKRMIPHEEGKEPRRGTLLEWICADFLAGVVEEGQAQ